MELDVAVVDGRFTSVGLKGKLDASGVDRIDTRFTAAIAAAGRPTAVDLSEVTILTSMGIRLLISNARALNLKGARMVVFGAQDLVRESLEHVALDQIIPVLATEQLAFELLRA